jgi:tRNA(Arg) A34 adenosine deaminase TadA
MTIEEDHYWMSKAIEQANLGKTPFGAVIVGNKEEYVEAYNTTKLDGPTAHAEINAIQKLKQLSYSNPKNLTLYSTVEPCPMCMSAIVWAGIGQVVFGATIDDASKFGSQIQITCKEVVDKSWYSIVLKSGVAREKCIKLFKK